MEILTSKCSTEVNVPFYFRKVQRKSWRSMAWLAEQKVKAHKANPQTMTPQMGTSPRRVSTFFCSFNAASMSRLPSTIIFSQVQRTSGRTTSLCWRYRHPLGALTPPLLHLLALSPAVSSRKPLCRCPGSPSPRPACPASPSLTSRTLTWSP